MMVFNGRTRSESTTTVLYACYYLSGKQWYVYPFIRL